MEETDADLSISAERAFFILTKARDYDAKVEQTDPQSGSNPADDGAVDVLEASRDDPTLEEYLGAMDALNEDEQLDLIAVLWIGRGDFDAADFNSARAEASSMRHKHIPSYIAETPLASDYLEAGFDALGISLQRE